MLSKRAKILYNINPIIEDVFGKIPFSISYVFLFHYLFFINFLIFIPNYAGTYLFLIFICGIFDL